MFRLRFTNRELSAALIITVFYLLTGFSLNPFDWPNQVTERFILTDTIQPDNPKIAQLEKEFKLFLEEKNETISSLFNTSNPKIIEAYAIEVFITGKINYVDDFANYLSWDHRTSISEVLARGDDCDGIAIIAASLLTRRGFDNYIIISKWHSWIEVDINDSIKINLFNSQIDIISPWYLKYNSEKVYIHQIAYFEIILHNFLLILFSLKIGVLFYTLIKNYQAFKEIYATILALILSPIPVLLILSALNV
ncbi:MAG: hypothetical protein ACTSW1_03705 [Candidatus Hodarchaeales archaeon]